MFKWIIVLFLAFICFCVYVYVDDGVGIALALGWMISASIMIAFRYSDGDL
jgi:hypothetical protein